MMHISRFFCKVCALVAVTLILPSLSYADHDGHGWGNHNDDRDRGGHNIPTVPDNGPGILLIAATIGGIMLVSARLSSRTKA